MFSLISIILSLVAWLADKFLRGKLSFLAILGKYRRFSLFEFFLLTLFITFGVANLVLYIGEVCLRALVALYFVGRQFGIVLGVPASFLS